MALASSRFKVPVKREDFILPGNVDEIVETIRNILNDGHVQGLIMTNGQPIKVYRAVQAEDITDNVSIDVILGSIDIFEYVADSSHLPSDRVVGMCKLLAKEKLNPVCFITGPNKTGLLDKWFSIEESGLPRGVDSLIGLPVIRNDGINEDTLVLCGAEDPFPDIEDITVAIKTDIELRGKNEYQRSSGNTTSSKTADRSGSDSEEYGQPANQLGDSPTERGETSWVPPRIVGKRKERSIGVH